MLFRAAKHVEENSSSHVYLNMIDPSSTEDESEEETLPRRTKPGKKQNLTSQESNAKELSLPSSDVPPVTHPPSRIHEPEGKTIRSRYLIFFHNNY